MQIQKLLLYTENLQGQINFYTQVLGLECVFKNDTSARFQMGTTLLCFEAVKKFNGPYHYAINIPCNKTAKALDWLQFSLAKQGGTVLSFEGQTCIDFSGWNAEAIYFYDADQNIVEFIARKNLANESFGAFSSVDFIEISEIGVPLNDIEVGCSNLFQIENMQIFDGSFDRFCALGDEQCLFICINKNKKEWFPTGDKAYASPFKVVLKAQHKQYSCKFDGEQLQVEKLF